MRRYPVVMLMLIALSMASMAGPPAPSSPAQRLDGAASASFTATATIRRGIGVGRDMAPPPWAHSRRKVDMPDATGRPHPVIITDFE